MSPTLTQNIGLIFVILCIVCSIESRARTNTNLSSSSSISTNSNKRREKSSVNLCSKDIDMKLACHCSHDDHKKTVIEVDCLVLHQDFSHTDPAWLSFRQHPNLKHFMLTITRNGYMSYLPSDILKYQKELKSITITYADIHEIPTYAFGNLTKLENITLIKSQIEVLDKNAFANHDSLKGLNLEDNQIIDIDRNAFVHLPELLDLVLTKNNITVLHEEMFVDLGKLAKLKLNENLISILTREMFKGLGNLKQLDLSFNNVKFIGDTVFAELWSLQELDLENNSIERLSERAFDGLNNLRSLNLKNNKLTALEGGVFTGVPALTNLNLNHNLLDTLTYNNILPLMDNLVNNTSILSISENQFVCDCRLTWIYDVRNRTKNFDLRRTIDRITCRMDNDHSLYKFNNKYNTNIRRTAANEYDDFGNDLAHSPSYGINLQHHQQQQHDFPEDNRIVALMSIGIDHLPCVEEMTDPTELPLSRESIGMDLSWLSGNGYRISCTKIVNAVGLIIVNFLMS